MKPITSPVRLLAGAFLLAAAPGLRADIQYVDLGGPAAGYLAVSNFKNAETQNAIEGKDANGNYDPGHNGLPDYPNYQIPDGPNAGKWTAIIASPQFAGADYSALYGGASRVTVNNRTITDSNYSTLSAGLIGFDRSLLTGTGLETIAIADLTFNLDTYAWDGTTGGEGSGQPWTVSGVPTNPYYISPFSTIYTEYNDAGGAGNAAIIYNLSLSNITGAGLTFQDGQLVSMDIDADLSVLMRIGNMFTDPANPFLSATFTGEFSASGLSYEFDLDDTQSVAVFSGIHMVMNRAGTASLVGAAVPEPAAFAALSGLLVLSAAFLRRRPRA